MLHLDGETRCRERAGRNQRTMAAVVPPLRRRTDAPEDVSRMRVALAGREGIADRGDLDVANGDRLVVACSGMTFARMCNPRHHRPAEFRLRLQAFSTPGLP